MCVTFTSPKSIMCAAVISSTEADGRKFFHLKHVIVGDRTQSNFACHSVDKKRGWSEARGRIQWRVNLRAQICPRRFDAH